MGSRPRFFKATDPSGHAALKIFDDDLIQRYGDKVQLERIHRELGLIGRHHPNIVSILGGGIHEGEQEPLHRHGVPGRAQS